jgi:hypothetical protein
VPTAIALGQYVPRVKSGHLVDRTRRRKPRVPSPGTDVLPTWLPVEEVVGPEGRMVLRADVTTFEEKGSNVNVASHLLIDVLTAQIEAAVVFSNDSDLRFPLEQARARIPVGTVNPGRKPTPAALQAPPGVGAGRHWWRRLRPNDYRNNQLPDPAGRHPRPTGW